MTEPTARPELERLIGGLEAAISDDEHSPYDEGDHKSRSKGARTALIAGIEQAILAAETAARSEQFTLAAKVTHGAIEQIQANKVLQAQVAALREALGRWRHRLDSFGLHGQVEALLSDTAASAEAYTARIREKVLEEAASAADEDPNVCNGWKIGAIIADRIRALATPPATEEAK